MASNGFHSTEDEDYEASFRENVLGHSAEMPEGTPVVAGVDFNDFKERDITVAEMVQHMANVGYQATAVSDATRIINLMASFPFKSALATRSWEQPSDSDSLEHKDEIFLGYTSNLVSSGLRSTLRYLVEHKRVTCIVATAGGVEEDIIKCLAPTYCSSFSANDAQLRADHINRIGNLRVPNNNYLSFEDWLSPLLDKMLDEQEASKEAWLGRRDQARDAAKTTGKKLPIIEDDTLRWTPSTFIARLGAEINDPSSICYWAQRNSIPVFCPGLTDGSMGDMIAQFTVRSRNRLKGAILDIDMTRDIDKFNMISRKAEMYHRKMGAIILGGGLVKHHIMNCCLQGGGADAAVYINTAQEYDGSDAGARPSEAVSWGKLKDGAPSVKVFAEATVVFPLIVAATWAKVGRREC
ncbi:MAG: hypothetical protein Q9217_005998 [Psora testacea]